jgi:hypothetical protein
MPFASLGKFLNRFAPPKLVKQTAAALALEAGTAYLGLHFPALASRTRLVSVKAGVLHAITVSAPARAELLSMKERLFQAMKSAAPIELNDLRVEIRGTLVEESWF